MSKNNFITFDGLELSVSIETPHYLSEFVEYPVKVTYTPNRMLSGETYTVVKRYSDFDLLKKALKGAYISEKLPPKRLLGKFDMNLVNERQVQLEKYLKCLIDSPFISKSIPVTSFLQKSNENVVDYEKHGFQQVSLDFRCETSWQINKLISEMGCRVKKTYISGNSLSDQNRYVLSWAEYGPEYASVNEKPTQKFLKSLSSIKHEYIYPISYVMLSDTGASFIRPFSDLGSLHDIMYKAKPQNSILSKYAIPPGSSFNLVNQISLFGRQILIGLKYLHDKEIPYGHLHLRNVLLVNDKKCGLSDIENCAMGLQSQHRNYVVGIMKKLTFVEIDIYSFGRLIYEMAFGEPLMSTYIENDDIIKWPSPTIRDFLFSVLTESILKNGFPTIDQMLELSLFKSYSSRPTDKVSFKISATTKEYLELVEKHSLKLLTRDQKLVKAEIRKREANALGIRKKLIRKEESRRSKHPGTVNTNDFGDVDILDSSPTPNTGSDPIANTSNWQATRKLSSPGSPPAPLAPPPPPPPPPPTASAASPATISQQKQSPMVTSGNTQLLNAICGFSKNNLRKARTNDRSCPKV